MIRYYLSDGVLTRVFKGVYALFPDWSEFELAQKLVQPSYISFQTALAHYGLVFQYDGQVHSAALISKKISVGEQLFSYHKLKTEIFYKQLGMRIDEKGHYIASPERAVCDTLYLHPGFGLDSYGDLDSGLLSELSLMYNNQRLVNEIKELVNQIDQYA